MSSSPRAGADDPEARVDAASHTAARILATTDDVAVRARTLAGMGLIFQRVGRMADSREKFAGAAELFVSARRVQTHLSHVYAKLGLSSRVQLARLAASGDGPPRGAD